VASKPPLATSAPLGLGTWWRDALRAGGTGGLNWHLHALASRRPWQSTVGLIDQFLVNTRPNSDHLLLIGPSAGWMMPTRWLTRFRRIDAYDIDPLAPWLFARLHGRALRESTTHWQFARLDAIANLPRLLQEHPKACVWFDNVLGQLRYRQDDEALLEHQMGLIRQMLQGRSWGSVHDLYSGPVSRDTDVPIETLSNSWTCLEPTPDGTERVRFNGQGLTLETATQHLLQSVQAEGVWQDHATAGVFPLGTPIRLIPWRFRQRYWHWLGAGWVQA
jgi:hypothetical protein